MKKALLSLVFIASIITVNAADNKNTAIDANKMINVESILEENIKINAALETLKEQAEDLNQVLAYNNLMNTTTNKINNEVVLEQKEEAKCLENYNKMMFKTLANLLK